MAILQVVIDMFKKLKKRIKCPFCGYEQEVPKDIEKTACLSCGKEFRVDKEK